MKKQLIFDEDGNERKHCLLSIYKLKIGPIVERGYLKTHNFTFPDHPKAYGSILHHLALGYMNFHTTEDMRVIHVNEEITPLPPDTVQKDYDIFEYLNGEKNPALGICDLFNRLPQDWSAFAGQFIITKELIRRSGITSWRDRFGMTTVHYLLVNVENISKRSNHHSVGELMYFLLENGFDPHGHTNFASPSKTGLFPTYIQKLFIIQAHVKSLKALLENGSFEKVRVFFTLDYNEYIAYVEQLEVEDDHISLIACLSPERLSFILHTEIICPNLRRAPWEYTVTRKQVEFNLNDEGEKVIERIQFFIDSLEACSFAGIPLIAEIRVGRGFDTHTFPFLRPYLDRIMQFNAPPSLFLQARGAIRRELPFYLNKKEIKKELEEMGLPWIIVDTFLERPL